jgi:type II secretory pathway component GspD/PulD (secretin)
MVVMAVVTAGSMATRADEPAKPPTVTKVFNVADLVIPIPECVQVGGQQVPEAPKPLLTDRLIESITQTIRPRSWNKAGGCGRIQFDVKGYALSVTNTPEAVAEVSDLLETLRRLQDTSVAFSVRVLTVPAEMTLPVCPAKEGEVVFLSENQLKTALEAVQTERRAAVMQMPKVTTFPGQSAIVCNTQTEPFVTGVDAQRVNGQVVLVPKVTPVELGTTLALRGRVSADKKFVTVNASYTNRHLEKNVELIPIVTQVTPVFEGGSQGKPIPFTQYLQAPQVEMTKIAKDDLTVAYGAHAVIAGPTSVQESRVEYGPPRLSQIPYVNRLFKNVGIGRTTMRTILIVSPVVIETER